MKKVIISIEDITHFTWKKDEQVEIKRTETYIKMKPSLHTPQQELKLLSL